MVLEWENDAEISGKKKQLQLMQLSEAKVEEAK
jgi:hypothetical protein